MLQRDGVPDNIKSFYKFNHIWRFRYDRPFHKGTKDKENEFKVQDRNKPHGQNMQLCSSQKRIGSLQNKRPLPGSFFCFALHSLAATSCVQVPFLTFKNRKSLKASRVV